MEFNNKLFFKMTDWSERTFPQRTNHSILTHMRRELDEIEESPGNIEEWADVMLLLMHGLMEQGFYLKDLLQGVISKFSKNTELKWKSPDEHGVVEHEKGED